MAAAKDSAEELEICIYIVPTDERMSTPESLKESVSPFLPVKQLFVEPRKIARSRFKYGRCDFIFHEMHIEQDATPIGLGMQSGDAVAFFPTFGKLSNTLNEELKELKDRKFLVMKTLGLNLCLGVTEGGLLFPREVGRHKKEIYIYIFQRQQ